MTSFQRVATVGFVLLFFNHCEKAIAQVIDLKGTWSIKEMHYKGVKQSEEACKEIVFAFEGGKLRMIRAESGQASTFDIDVDFTSEPARIDLVDRNSRRTLGILREVGGTLSVNLGAIGSSARPEGFDSSSKNCRLHYDLVRNAKE